MIEEDSSIYSEATGRSLMDLMAPHGATALTFPPPTTLIVLQTTSRRVYANLVVITVVIRPQKEVARINPPLPRLLRAVTSPLPHLSSPLHTNIGSSKINRQISGYIRFHGWQRLRHQRLPSCLHQQL